ncbi:MAG: panT [Haloplasmataceae bacterium]|jgi:uncharacterized membrane protein|nr:panT [Haloplasmataceae bacterium]
MRNQKVNELVYLSVFLSIIIIMGWVPWLGFIPLGFIDATILHIPVLVAVIYFGRRFGILTGLMFGIVSLVISYLRPGPTTIFFQNPIISVLPRIIFAYLTYLIYASLRNFVKNYYVLTFVTAILGSLVHSVLVLGTLAFVYSNDLSKAGLSGAIIWAVGILATVSTIEAVVGAIVATPIVAALKQLNQKGNDNLLNELNE